MEDIDSTNTTTKLEGIKYIVLDIDSTLIYYSHKDNEKGFKIQLIDSQFKLNELTIIPRPYLYDFLSYIKERYTIIIWTAAKRQYAEAIMNRVLEDYNDTLIWTRDECDKNNLKDLSKLAKELKVNKDELFLIDDYNEHFNRYKQRGYIIHKFKGSEDDTELLKLIECF